MLKNLVDIKNYVDKHEKYRNECLNLIASENFSSKSVRDFLTSDLNNRYGCYPAGTPEHREYTGNSVIHELEEEVGQLFGKVFNAKYVDLRPLGGHMAGGATVLSLLEPNDLVFEIHLRDWGHGLVEPMRTAKQLEKTIRTENIPFTDKREIDVQRLKQLCEEKKPKMIIFGSSGMLFPDPIKEVAQWAKPMGIILAQDTAHITGLIAAGKFPNPLDQGCDVFFGSTHKSFPGPQGGFVATNDWDIHCKIGNVLGATFVTSHHLQRLPALAAALLEMEQYGKEYITQVINNSRVIGKALAEQGINVAGGHRGYTESHLILADVTEHGGGHKVSKLLEEANILISDDFGQDDHDIRIGTAEATRRGMKESEMTEIGKLICDILIAKKPVNEVKKAASNLSLKFSGVIEYSFDK